jgi:hypothetical protein
MVIWLYVEGTIALARLGGILQQIRIERERNNVTEIVRKANLVSGVGQSMFINHDTFFELLNQSDADAAFLWAVVDVEAHRLGDGLYSLALSVERDSKMSSGTKFPQAQLDKIYREIIIKDADTMTSKRLFIREVLYSTAAYIALRLYELKVITQQAITNEMMFLKMQWKL